MIYLYYYYYRFVYIRKGSTSTSNYNYFFEHIYNNASDRMIVNTSDVEISKAIMRLELHFHKSNCVRAWVTDSFSKRTFTCLLYSAWTICKSNDAMLWWRNKNLTIAVGVAYKLEEIIRDFTFCTESDSFYEII